MSITIQKKDGPIFVADSEQLGKALDKKTKHKLILAGQLIFCSMEDIRAKSSQVTLPSRRISKSLIPKKSENSKLFLAIEKETAAALNKASVRPCYAVDALLHYGQKLSKTEDAFVISAIESSSATLLSILHFKKGILTDYSENILTTPMAHTFEADLHVLLESLRSRSPAAVLHWCSPLVAPRTLPITTAPSSMWNYAPPQSIAISGKPNVLARYGIPVLIVGGAIAGGGGAVYLPYLDYQNAAKELAKGVEVLNAKNKESKSPLGEYQFASDRLKTLEARQSFFKKVGDSDKQLEQLEIILAACAKQEGLIVVNSRVILTADKANSLLASNAAPGFSPDFEIVIEIPKKDELLILEQSEPILRALSLELGLSLRLAVTDGFKEKPGATAKDPLIRTYRIQGAFSHAA